MRRSLRAASPVLAPVDPQTRTKTGADAVRRGFLIATAWACVAMAVVGIFLPLMPTTVFLIAAAWAFARSDPRRYQWLREHARFGDIVRAWEDHHAMPGRAKRLALLALAFSYLLMATVFGPLSWAAILGGVCIAAVALYIAHIPVLNQDRKLPSRS